MPNLLILEREVGGHPIEEASNRGRGISNLSEATP